MPIQRESDTEPEEDTVSDMPSLLPAPKAKRVASEAQLKALEFGRQRKAELKEQRAKERQESLVLAQQVKKIKDPVSKEVIKQEVIKANVIRQKKPTQVFPVPPPEEPDETPIQKTRKQPKILVEESEPEVIIVKRPKKKIVVEETETETEPEVKPKPRSRRTARKPREPMETDDSESDYGPPPPRPALQRYPRNPPAQAQGSSLGFKINF